MSEHYNVVFYDDQGYWDYLLRDVGGKRAVEAAKRLVDTGRYSRVQITDEEDFTNFLWERGKGVVFPPLGAGE